MIEDYYIECVKKHPSYVDNGHGKPTITYSDTSINGYIGHGNNIQVQAGGKVTIETRYNFYCDHYTWEIGDFILYENIWYEVLGVPQNTVHKNHHCKLTVKTVQGLKGG